MKTLQDVKALLFSYAFARPQVRFSIRVLKAKNDKANWTYATSSNDSLAEIAAKIVGKEIASECTGYKVSSDDPDVDVEDGWEVEAFLVSAQAGACQNQVNSPGDADLHQSLKSSKCNSVCFDRWKTCCYRPQRYERDHQAI